MFVTSSNLMLQSNQATNDATWEAVVCYSPCRNFFEKIVFLTYLFGSKLCDSGFSALGFWD